MKSGEELKMGRKEKEVISDDARLTNRTETVGIFAD